MKTKKQWYKRWWAIVLWVFIALIILGNLVDDNSTIDNQDSSNTNDNTQTTNNENEEQEEVTYNIGDSIVAGDYTWKITGVEEQSQVGESIMGTFMGDTADGVFLIFDVEVTNNGNSADYIMSGFMKLYDSQGREYVEDTQASFYLGDTFPWFDQINPGLTKKGKVVFDVVPNTDYEIRISSNLYSDSFKTIKNFI
jgi:hypothetical protein